MNKKHLTNEAGWLTHTTIAKSEFGLYTLEDLKSKISFDKRGALELVEFILDESIDDIKRQAFEAGRERDFNENKMGDYKYDSFDDYQNRGI